MRSVRIATWNVHGLRAGVGLVAETVRPAGPDILLVQESGSRRRLAALGEALGMTVTTDPVVFPRRRVRNGVLVRPPLEARSQRFVRFSGGSWRYPRGAMIASVDGLTAVSLHLGLRSAERRRHVRQLLQELRDVEGPTVIGGDLNAHPDDRALAAIAAAYPDVWASVGEGPGLTMPADRPTARIDFLFAGPAVRAIRAWTAGGAASDHLMVVVDLEVD